MIKSKQFNPDKFLQLVSSLPGVYQMFADDGKIIYIGKAKNLKNRLSSYFKTKSLGGKTKSLVAKIADIQTIITNTETEALILENNLIKKHLPRYNVLLRDDKSYPYIFLSNHIFPRLGFHRGVRKAKGQYFGPYPSSHSVKESLRLLQKIFPVRQCEDSFFKHRSRPCLQAQIGRCTAPCVDNISPEEYAIDVKNAILFLNGKSSEATTQLQINMKKAANRQAYETAAKFRDQITHLRHIQEQQFVDNLYGNFDILAIAHKLNQACVQLFVFRNGRSLGSRAYFLKQIKDHSSSEILKAFISQHYLNHQVPTKIICNILPRDLKNLQSALSSYSGNKIEIKTAQRGEKVQLLKTAVTNAELSLQERINTKTSIIEQLLDLQAACNLEESPKHIECFDISHTFGEATVASCVVFKNGEPSKGDYRKFNILDVAKGDDYAAMLQAINRRYTRIVKKDAQLPDLLIIDGGKGQLTQAIKALQDLQVDIPLLGVAKGAKRQAGKETLFLSATKKQIILPPENKALLMIQKIRDEAHRFAITGHRAKRGKQRTSSSLQDIPGIGNKRRQALLNYFGGLQEVKKAGVLDLAKVCGISNTKAQEIYNFFHG